MTGKADNLISDNEKGVIQSCASQAYDKDNVKVLDKFDNCPDNCNVLQLDGDGIGDVCAASPGCGGCGQPACEQIIPNIKIIE